MLYYVAPEHSDTTYTVSTGDWMSSVMDYRKTLVYCTKDAHYTTTAGYQGGGMNDDGVYTITDVNGNSASIHMNVTHDPNNDLDHNYVYTACDLHNPRCDLRYLLLRAYILSGISCTAKSYCVHDESHVLMDIGTVTSRKDGNTTIYTAAFNNKSFETQIIKVTDGMAEPVTEPTTEPSPEPATGDVNGDGDFGVADILHVQKWMLGRPNTRLANWKAVDFYPDGIIDVFDLALMKRVLLDGTHHTDVK